MKVTKHRHAVCPANLFSLMYAMILKVLPLLLLSAAFVCVKAQPVMVAQKCFGGTKDERTFGPQLTSDGGLLLVGTTNSDDGDVAGLHDTLQDVWVAKLDAAWNIEWQRCLGGSQVDFGFQGFEAGNGYMIVSYTSSNDGDVSGNHGDLDYWVVRLNMAGEIVWQKTIGGLSADHVQFSTLATDLSVVIAGYSDSNDGDFGENKGGLDVWITKVDTLGSIVWNKNYGGSDDDIGEVINRCSDGGYIVAAASSSSDGNVDGCDSTFNTWVVRLDANGDLLWQKCLGGSDAEQGVNAMEASDGSIVALSFTASNDGDVSGNHGSWDYWLTRLDSQGNLLWQKCYGGSDIEFPLGLMETPAHHFILGGFTYSMDGQVTGNAGSSDGWLVEADENGNLTWAQCAGGTGSEVMWMVCFLDSSTMLFSGTTDSNDGDVSGNHGANDIWLIKYSLTTTVSSINHPPPLMLRVLTNPVADQLDISLTAASPAMVRVNLINEAGQLVIMKNNVQAVAGELTLSLDCSLLPSGFYHLLVGNETVLQQEKIVIVK